MNSNTISIIHVIVGLNVGGAELMLKRLIESHLSNKNYKHTVVSLSDLGKVGYQLRELGIDIYIMNMRNAFSLPLVLIKLTCLIRRLSPDIVQTWMYHADLIGGLAARLAGIQALIWGIRTTSLAGHHPTTTKLTRKLCAIFSGHLPAAIVCAAEAARKSHIRIGYETARMLVIPNGFELTHLVQHHEMGFQMRVQYGWNLSEIVIGFVGRFHEDKGQQEFVLATAKLAAIYKNISMLMVGNGLDAGNTELCSWLDATGFRDRYVLLGERSDVSVCLAAMNIFCLASRTEGFPNVVGEAMAMALPCVVSNVGDAALLVADTGIVVPSHDPIALSEGLQQLIEMHPSTRQKLGRLARERIETEFNIDRTRKRFEVLYERVISNPRNWFGR